MGSNAAPELTNLCLYTEESRWVDSLIRSGDITTARLHAHTSRFIDDMLSWATEPPQMTSIVLNMWSKKTSMFLTLVYL